MDLSEILTQPDGPDRTAELVAWLQGLYETEPPILVGGAAVELLTGGAYTTGDLDFVGHVPKEVEHKLREAGFESKGRHWVHSVGRVFVEFPSGGLGAGESSVALELAGRRLLVLAPEAVIVDRLAAWEFWNSTTDAVNAFLVLRALGDRIEEKSLEQLAKDREVGQSLASLLALDLRFRDSDPTQEELVQWAERRES